MKIFSFSPFGYEGSLVAVEVDLRRGIPAVDIVGLADSAVKESRERMQAAIRNSNFEFPPERVLISLSPADLKKEGAGFDLPIALGVLQKAAESSGYNDFIDSSILIMGELELSGNIRPVKGVHAAVSEAASHGITRCIVPIQNADEALEIPGVFVFGAESLESAFLALKDDSLYETKKQDENSNTLSDDIEEVDGILFKKILINEDFSYLKGQYQLVRALQIAAAGGHNVLATGSPGCGKTMAIQMFPSINPILTTEESQSVTRIWSLAGLIKQSESLIRIPPFRIPHQTASIEGICGGGPYCRPGEISLAHNGVLFLDEAAEFKTAILQMLRVPLESGAITLSRAGRSTVYPAKFQLLLATNPCPCGNYGSKTKICLCSAKSIEQYWRKFSAPLLDRIDLRVFVENNSDENIQEKRKSLNSTKEIRKGIANAVSIQRKRQKVKNANLSPTEIEKYCELSTDCQNSLHNAVLRYNFSQRAINSCIKIARTIADIENYEQIKVEHIEEAVLFRKVCANMMPEI